MRILDGMNPFSPALAHNSFTPFDCFRIHFVKTASSHRIQFMCDMYYYSFAGIIISIQCFVRLILSVHYQNAIHNIQRSNKATKSDIAEFMMQPFLSAQNYFTATNILALQHCAQAKFPTSSAIMASLRHLGVNRSHVVEVRSNVAFPADTKHHLPYRIFRVLDEEMKPCRFQWRSFRRMSQFSRCEMNRFFRMYSHSQRIQCDQNVIQKFSSAVHSSLLSVCYFFANRVKPK